MSGGSYSAVGGFRGIIEATQSLNPPRLETAIRMWPLCPIVSDAVLW